MAESRIEKLRRLVDRRGIDAVALIPGANLCYLTGLEMHTSERVTLALLTREGQGYMILPALEMPRVQSRLQVPIKLYPWTDAEGPLVAWDRLQRDLVLAGKTIAVEFLNMRVLELTGLQAYAPGLALADASELLAELRMVKDQDEIAAMRRAARVIEKSLEEIFRLVKPGVTEKELATQWQLSMSRSGSDTIPEVPIVASGPNSAQPHTIPTERQLEIGDLVTFDGWCQVDGYFTDITRTVAVREVSSFLSQIYEVVARANEAGRRRVAPGIRCEEVDRATREVIAAAGFGNYIFHRTGHGLGLEIHESPSIVEGNTLALVPGMTFTVEPGVYVAGQGGVRIEDDVVVTQDGSETLTTLTRELLTL